MARTVILLGYALFASTGIVDAEESSLARLPAARTHAIIASSGLWRVDFDHKLDGKLETIDSSLLTLSAVNHRLTGHYKDRRAADKENNSLFAGSVIPGSPAVVTLRQDDPLGYTAVYTGRLVSAGRIVGSYMDNRGYGGDWSLTLISQRAVEPLSRKLPDESLFESVLGVYGKAIRGKRQPFVNLRPPSRNLWTPEIQEAVQDTLPYGEVDYIGTAQLVVPQPGIYSIDMPGAGVQFRLNGRLLEAGEVHLSKGVYEVEIYTNHWGQPYLTYAQVAVIHKDTKAPVPFVNTAGAVERFRSSKIEGRRVVEVCKYTPRQVAPEAEVVHLKARLEIDRLRELGAKVTVKDGQVVAVNLTNSTISDTDMELLSSLAALELLTLNGCRNLTDAGLVYLKPLNGLKGLALERTNITDAGLENVKGLTQLTLISLNGTRVGDAGLEHLKDLTKLSTLYLAATRTADAGVASLKNMAQLSWLDLSHTQVTDAGLRHLSGLSQMRLLSLYGIPMTDAGVQPLTKLLNLEQLTLNKTQVTDAGLLPLSKLPKLQELNLRGTRVTERGLQQIQQALPDCRIDLRNKTTIRTVPGP